MTKLQYNLDEITSITVPPGKYRARLVKVEYTLSSKKNPMLVWHWKIADGDQKGKELRSFTSLLDNALFGLKEHLEAFGLKGRVDSDTSKLVGRYVKLVVGLRLATSSGGVEREVSGIAAILPDKKVREQEFEEDEEEDGEDEEETEEEEASEDEDFDEETDEYEEDEEDEETEEEPAPNRRLSRAAERRSGKPGSSKKKKRAGQEPF